MSGPEPTVWLNALLGFLQWAQHGVLVLLHTLGLAGEVHGSRHGRGTCASPAKPC